MKRRMLLLFLCLPIYVVMLAMMFVGIVMIVGDDGNRSAGKILHDIGRGLRDWDYLGPAFTIAAVITLTQGVFLFPVFRLRPPQGIRSKSLTFSLLIGTVVAALLTTGLLVGLSELVASMATGVYTKSPWIHYGGGEDMGDYPSIMIAAGAGLVLCWCGWSFLLFVYSRHLWADRALGRLVSQLFGGTIIGLMVIIPIDVMVKKRTDCYCHTGTFWSLLIGATGALWLSGPGIYFLVTAKKRRLFRKAYCGQCGYLKGPSPGKRCSECGFEWLK